MLAPDEIRRRLRGLSPDDSKATANFRLGLWLSQHGAGEAAAKRFATAVQLRPDSWNFRRQKIVLSDPALTGQFAATPEFWEAVDALGEQGNYYAPIRMEGKAVLFKEFAGVDAFPICVDTQDVDEIVSIVRAIAPVFGGINLEDISAPRCFDVEARLQDLGIPVFHDDQHGTAIVTVAALLNAFKVSRKSPGECSIVFSGSGASAIACAKLIQSFGKLGHMSN